MRQEGQGGDGRWVVRLVSLVLLGVGLVERLDTSPRADVYFDVPLAELSFEAGEEPPPDAFTVAFHQPRLVVGACAQLDGAGEAYAVYSTSERRPDVLAGAVRLAARAPAGAEVRGTLWLPTGEGAELRAHRFRLDASAADPAARVAWLTGRYQHYAAAQGRRLPGAAWFRHMKELARRELVEAGAPVPPDLWVWPREDWRRPGELEDSYELMTGGRALSENLQLERALTPANQTGAWTPIGELEGITVREFDWKALTEGLEPELDPLADLIPADQHALFLPRFSALVDLVDEALAHGTPVLHLLEPRAEDARTLARYERQLGVSLDELARAFGDTLAKSVAVTGSDPYLRTGSDVALLLEARQPQVLMSLLRARQQAAAEREGAASVEVELAGRVVFGVDTGDWRVSSWVTRLGDTVVLSNTLGQIERILQAASGVTPALAALDEYVFFRDRYARSEPESALLVISDATIRRWCGPKWRIGASRRTRAAAVMLDEQCAQLAELASGDVRPRELRSELPVPGGGAVWLDERGVTNDVYGSPDFLTPIAYLDIERVAPDEVRQYQRYRDLYQREWRRFFDPIAARVLVEDERLALDLTVMPLIDATDYDDVIDLTRGVALAPDAGDPHHEAILHYVFALNRESRSFKQMSDFLTVIDARVGSGLDWVGDTVELWLDADPVWEGLDDPDRTEDFFFEHLSELPVALRVDSRSTLKLAAFLTAARAFIVGTAPNLLIWETRQHDEHGEHSYIAIRPLVSDVRRGGLDALAIYYVALPDALLLSLSEAVVRRAIDRHVARLAGEALPASRPWRGESSAVRVQDDAIRVALEMFGDRWREDLQRSAWDALPILNEWRRLYPDEDPVAFHQRFFTVRLTDPGGGAYDWDAERGTMASTVLGSPAAPRMEVELPAVLERLTRFDAGLTFEHDGLRARVDLGWRTD